ncbi:MAG: hypothetical protein JWM76_3095 [Pseudonocardiales bacterium]|nr:hypothetical protein [Pseudonocardiales bacterium]
MGNRHIHSSHDPFGRRRSSGFGRADDGREASIVFSGRESQPSAVGLGAAVVGDGLAIAGRDGETV